jgi:hypothetical protein
MPYGGQRVAVDNILIPTGDIATNAKGSVNDFWSASKQIGHSFDDPELQGNCGFNCTGYGMQPLPLSIAVPSQLLTHTTLTPQITAGL